MKILLTCPPHESGRRFHLPPLGLAYLAAALKREGRALTVIDCSAERLGQGAFVQKVKTIAPQIVGITSDTFLIPAAHRLAQASKEACPEALTIIGGPHASAIPAQTLKEFPAFDIAVQGEGEHTLLELCEAIEKGDSPAQVPGIFYREAGNIRPTTPRPHMEDLDRLPIPLWEAFPIHAYRSVWGLRKKLEFPLMTGRGCPYPCIFCQRSMGTSARLRSPEHIAEELEYDLKLGAQSIHFSDEIFTFQKERTLAICDEIRKRGLEKKLKWNCETRVDHVDRELLAAMRSAGCNIISFGVESGNAEILDHCKKGITVGQIREAFSLAKNAGLKTYMLLLFGLPFETEKSIEDTRRLMMEVNPDYVSISILVPFPGTEALRMAEEGIGGLRITSTRWEDYGKHMGDAIELEQLSRKKIKSLQSRTYSTFYLRPSRIFHLFELASLRGIFSLAQNRIFRR